MSSEHQSSRSPETTAEETRPEPVIVGWSGGKDSSLALHAALRDPAIRIHSLLTTVTEPYERISMHGVRVELLEEQAAALGYPLKQVRIPAQCSNADYERAMESALLAFREEGVRRCIFGDLFLEDIRDYRNANLAKVSMQAIYPVWGLETAQLARDFVEQGFRAVLVCVDPKQLDARFCGREFDHALLDDLPSGVDPCGENGEFHTFVYNGPIFDTPVQVRTGDIVERDGFWFCDLLPDKRT